MKYIMMLTTGEYSDRCEVPVCYFDSKEEAEQAITKANEQLRKHGYHKQCENIPGYHERNQVSKKLLEMIPTLKEEFYWSLDYTGADFYLVSVKASSETSHEIPDSAFLVEELPL